MEGRIPFDIKYRSDIEAGKYLVVTRCNEPVRIICWDAKGLFPIVGLAKAKRSEFIETYSTDGKRILSQTSDYDLLLVVNPDYKEPPAEPSVSAEPSVDWDAFRREAAKDFVAALFANPNCNNLATDSIIKNCIAAADELVWNLKKKKK